MCTAKSSPKVWRSSPRNNKSLFLLFGYRTVRRKPLTSTAVFILYIRSLNSNISKFTSTFRKYVSYLLFLKSQHLQGNTSGVFRWDDNKMKYYGPHTRFAGKLDSVIATTAATEFYYFKTILYNVQDKINYNVSRSACSTKLKP